MKEEPTTVHFAPAAMCVNAAIFRCNPTTDQALWWQGSVATTDQALWWQGNAAYHHWVKIGSATYPCLEDSLNSAGVASNIAAQINASDPNCSCTTEAPMATRSSFR